MLRRIGQSIISLIILAGVFSPWATILLSPQYAFAQTVGTVQVPAGSATGNQVARNGGTLDLSSAAAGGVVSVGTCLAAAGITLSAGLAWIAGALGFSTAAAVGGGAASTAATVSGLVVPVVAPASDLILKSIAANTLNTAALVSAQVQKSSVFNCIAWALAKAIWRAVAASVIDWINSGFNGRPAFIQDLGRFMQGIADEAIGSIILADPTLSFLCSPFSLQVRLALAVSYSRRSAPSCTLTQVMQNIKNFMNNFSQGGWPAWIELTQENNNPYGAYLVGRGTIDIAIRTAQGQKMSLLNWSGGFLSKTEKVCTTGSNGQQSCRDIVVTPGELIAKQAGEVIGQGNTQLLLADEMNQIISALVSQLLQKALQSFSGLSGGSGYQDDYYRSTSYTGDLSGSFTPGVSGVQDVIDLINQDILTEEDFQQESNAALNVLGGTKSDLQQARSCWNQKVSDTGLTPDQLATAQAAALTASTTLSSMGGQTTLYQTNIASSTANVPKLQALITRAQNTTTQVQLDTVVSDYYTLRAGGGFATPASIQQIQIEIANLQTTYGPQSLAAQQSLLTCSYFPSPVPAGVITTATTTSP